jgi:hypothetical protein
MIQHVKTNPWYSRVFPNHLRRPFNFAMTYTGIRHFLSFIAMAMIYFIRSGILITFGRLTDI